MAIKYEVLARGEAYTDKSGAEKVRWIKCGVILETKTGGMAMKLDSVPVVSDGWFSLFPPKEREDNQSGSKHASPKHKPADNFDDDLPDF